MNACTSNATNGTKPRLPVAGFQLIPNLLVNEIADGRLRANDVVVYLTFKAYQRGKEFAWPSNGTVAGNCGMSVSTLARCVERLETGGHLRRQRVVAGGTVHTSLKTTVEDGRVVVGVPQVTGKPPAVMPDAGFASDAAPLFPDGKSSFSRDEGSASGDRDTPQFAGNGINSDDEEPPF